MDLLIVQRPQISEEEISGVRSKFAIEPLEPGFGYTLGNSLRRTLLSSIPGAAITQIKIDSVLHEFSTIEGVTEDVTDVVLNLKELVIKSENDDATTVHLRVTGPTDVRRATSNCRPGLRSLIPSSTSRRLTRRRHCRWSSGSSRDAAIVPRRSLRKRLSARFPSMPCFPRSGASRMRSSRLVSSR